MATQINKEESYKSGFGDDFTESWYAKSSIGDFRVLKTTLAAFDSDGNEQLGLGGVIEVIDVNGVHHHGDEKKALFAKIKYELEPYEEDAQIDTDISYPSGIVEHLQLRVETYSSPSDLDEMTELVLEIIKGVE